MPMPWLRLIDVAVGLMDLRSTRKNRRLGGGEPPAGRRFPHLEARIAGVMVEALGEVFERDRRREALAFARLEEERRQAEREHQLALIRQAGDREIGRLRLVAGLALAGWVGSLVIAVQLAGTSAGPRVVVFFGWVVLLAAMTSALAAQANLAAALARLTNPTEHAPDSGIAGAAATWLLVFGLALIAIAALMV